LCSVALRDFCRGTATLAYVVEQSARAFVTAQFRGFVSLLIASGLTQGARIWW
jgi:hypothetical protein